MQTRDMGFETYAGRRRLLRAGLGLGAAGLLADAVLSRAFAQAYPSRPIRVLVPVPPGAGPDVDMRNIALKLTSTLGPVVVENRPGAATRIATELAVRAPADGYTFMMATPSMVLNPLTRSRLSYDYQRDLAPVTLMSTAGYALVVSAPGGPRSFEQFVQQARAAPGQTTFATLGAGTVSHLTAAWLCEVTGIDGKFVHYQTSAPYNDVATSQVSAVFESVNPLQGYIQGGKLRPLAIAQAARHRQYPDVPTFAEAGYPQFTPLVWSGLVAPAETPQPLIDRFCAAVGDVIRSPEYVRFSEDQSRIPVGSTPAEFRAFLEHERAQWAPIVKKLGISLD